jgi:acyl-CoA synthetase (AMP-forming)/AMP-acid ligase II
MHGLMMDAPLLVTEIMRFAERNFPDNEIVSVTLDQPRHRTTWREVFRRARQLANALRAAGVQPGDRVGTLAWNDYRHLELYYAVSCMGAVLHTVNPRLFPEQLEFIINHAEDKLLFVDATLLPVIAPLQGKLPSVQQTIVLTSAAAMPPAVAGKLPASPPRSTGPCSTSVARARSATRPARPATRKACSTATARRCSTHTAAAWPTRSVSPVAIACSPSCRCSTPTPGDSPTTRR